MSNTIEEKTRNIRTYIHGEGDAGVLKIPVLVYGNFYEAVKDRIYHQLGLKHNHTKFKI